MATVVCIHSGRELNQISFDLAQPKNLKGSVIKNTKRLVSAAMKSPKLLMLSINSCMKALAFYLFSVYE